MGTDLIHTKVYVGVWTAESFAFLRRHFRNLLLLAFFHGLLFLGMSPYGLPLPYDEYPFSRAVFWILFLVFDWMIPGWSIRTAKTGSGSWKNLRFSSWNTLPKLIHLVALVAALYFAVWYPQSHCRIFLNCPYR